jgi:septal ring factor EnvC (AmiA/AmiB activator)
MVREAYSLNTILVTLGLAVPAVFVLMITFPTKGDVKESQEGQSKQVQIQIDAIAHEVTDIHNEFKDFRHEVKDEFRDLHQSRIR